MTKVSTADLERIRAAFESPHLTIGSGLGTAKTPGEGTACTIAEINLVLTGTLSDGPHPCISETVRRWVIRVQDAIPSEIRNSPEWRAAAVGIAGSASTPEDEDTRRKLLLDWMWDRLADPGVIAAVPASASKAWTVMLEQRTPKAARAYAAYAYADAYAAAAYAAAAYADDAADAYAYAAAGAVDAADAAAYAAADAVDADAAYAAADADAARRAFWQRADVAGTLARLIEVGR